MAKNILTCVLDRKLPFHSSPHLFNTRSDPSCAYIWNTLFFIFIFFTYSLDQNSYEVSFGVLILLSPHHWTANEDRDVNKCFKLMSKWMKDWVYAYVLSSVPGRGDTKRKKTEGVFLQGTYKWTNNLKTDEHFKGQIQWALGADMNLAWFGVHGSDTSTNAQKVTQRRDLRK